MSWLINPAQLDKFRKSQKNLIIFDASVHLAAANRDAYQEFIATHIPGAQFFDIDIFSDTTTSVPHMLIHDEKLISEKLSALGVRNDYKIIFYDNSELHSAYRALWMFKVFGHNPFQLYVLDGGLPAWLKYSNKTETGEVKPSAKTYTASFQPQYLRTLQQMKENIHHPTHQVVDLRHPIRFVGGPEARPQMRAGHIPGSFSFPYFTMFDGENCLKPIDKIRQQMETVSIDLNSPIIATCGSAITASILDFVLDLLEHKDHALYDGSWSEWGFDGLYANEASLAERPVATCLVEL